MTPAALALTVDLGSTLIKAGVLDAAASLTGIRSTPAPPLSGSGLIREGRVDDYADAAFRTLFEIVVGLPAGTPVGIATQRSTFVLWERGTGRPLTPLISWQDRRAADWCARNEHLADEIAERTGLLLSAHYVGPKLAALQEADPGLRRLLRGGQVLFGTLETFLIWNWTSGRAHETDLGVAARTLLLDLAAGDWDDRLLDVFGVPREILPVVRPTAGRQTPLDFGLTLTASVSDQASGALAVLQDPATGSEQADCVLVTLGTGGFVLRPMAIPPGGGRDTPPPRRRGYLTAPTLGDTGGVRRWVLEGTINGAGAALDRFQGPRLGLTKRDTAPGAFCLPDVAGLGSPYWRPDIGLRLSAHAAQLDDGARRRVVAEGLLFRIRQIVEDLCGGTLPRRILLSGGVARDPFVAPGLAALLGHPLELLGEPEAGLIGAGRLAAGLDPFSDPPTRRVEPPDAGGYLPRKYAGWREWLAGMLSEYR